MGDIIRIKVLNLGSCNGCDVEIMNLFHRESEFCLAEEEVKSDVLLITGCLTRKNMERISNRQGNKSTPILLIGTCAISGGLFISSGLDLARILESDNLVFYVFGCPPSPEVIANAIEEAVRQRRGTEGCPPIR